MERRQRAVGAYRRGLLAESEQQLLLAVDEREGNPLDPVCWQLLGHIALRDQRPDDAVARYGRAARYAEGVIDILAGVAMVGQSRALQVAGNYVDALLVAENALKLAPTRWDCQYELARARSLAGVAPAGIEPTLVKAFSSAPRETTVICSGDVAIHLDDYSDALVARALALREQIAGEAGPYWPSGQLPPAL